MPHARILVTGSAGAVGYHVGLGLQQRGHLVRGFDLGPQRLAGEHRIGSLLDVEALRNAARGMDTIVHLAATPDVQSFADALVPNNIVGTHNVLEAARIEGIRRVVNTSSIRVVAGLSWETGQIGLDAGVMPDDLYGVTKVTGELLAQTYSRRFGFSVITARLGWLVRNRHEANHLPTLRSGPRIYLSHDDARAFFCRAVEQPNIPSHSVLYVTSHNQGDAAFDLEPAKRLLGYEPQDSFPRGSVWSPADDFPSPGRRS
jgi:uronate dehydrogenase